MADKPARPRRHVPYWHLMPFGIFIFLNLIALWQLYPRLYSIAGTLDPFGFIVFGLATYRIAQIIANERVTSVVRAPFVNVKDEGGEQEEEVPKPRGIRETLGTLLYCPSCVGVWAAAFLAYLAIIDFGIALIVAIIFALSACERIMTTVLDRIEKDPPAE
jgi:hypothetical protein